MTDSTEPRFSSRLGLILSVLGIAVGTGNIWRFPRIAAQQSGDEGAGAFLVAWVVFLFIWSIPLIIAEYAIGRTTRRGLVGSFASFAGQRFAWMGTFIAFVATAIMFYYSVVAGWCVFYFIRMLSAPLPTDTAGSTEIWESFQSSGWPVAFHALAMLVGAIVVWKGVKSIERANKVLIPVLLAVVLISLVRAVTLDGAGDGIRFLFTPQWELLTKPRIWLEALTQNAWDTGAGWGLILTYAIYMRRRHGVVKNAFITAIGNNTVSLLAAITIFAAVFAIYGVNHTREEILVVMKESGPASTGLTFIWIPQLLAKIGFGRGLAILFFLGLSFAAFSSLIAMIELATRVCVDSGMKREKAVAIVCGAGFTFGLPSAIYLGFLGNQDFVWGVALMLAGAFVAFAVRRYGAGKLRSEIIETSPGDWRPSRAWQIVVAWLVPIQAIALLGWWLYLAATEYDPGSWWNPLKPFSVMTCVAQWAVILALAIILNRRIVRAQR